ncbi:MAG: TadE family protein [Acidimicrobiales bacterium]
MNVFGLCGGKPVLPSDAAARARPRLAEERNGATLSESLTMLSSMTHVHSVSTPRGSGQSGSQRRRRRGQRGAALIEFAIVLPLLAILICGVIDLGRAYHLKNQLKNAAREGAVYGQTHPLSRAEPPFSNDPDVPCANEQSIQARAYGELQQSGQASPENMVIVIEPFTNCNVTIVDGPDSDPIPDLDPTEELTVRASADFKLITPLISGFFGSPMNITESVKVEIQ